MTDKPFPNLKCEDRMIGNPSRENLNVNSTEIMADAMTDKSREAFEEVVVKLEHNRHIFPLGEYNDRDTDAMFYVWQASREQLLKELEGLTRKPTLEFINAGYQELKKTDSEGNGFIRPANASVVSIFKAMLDKFKEEKNENPWTMESF